MNTDLNFILNYKICATKKFQRRLHVNNLQVHDKKSVFPLNVVIAVTFLENDMI